MSEWLTPMTGDVESLLVERGDVVIGVDVGGTFTDVLSFSSATRSYRFAKVPSTPANQAKGFMNGIAGLDLPLSQVASVVHGTTVATNAVLERKGARCGMITTRGFRDLVELGRRTRPQAYGMTGYFEPLIDRELRQEVTERIDGRGEILTPLDEDDVVRCTERLIALGAEAVVIHFMHSYANPAHERRAAEIVRRVWPNEFVSVGSDILNEIREFERGSTVSINAYVQPKILNYIRSVDEGLASRGLRDQLLITQGNGGTMSAGIVVSRAVQTVMSGPAAGVVAAAETARQAGFTNVITGDMGGTSFDVALIVDGRPAISAEKDIDYGLPVRVPMVDIHTIGAGGGSIAHVNAAGLLEVGPESAGSWPGPIGYGRGGGRPTVTDANLLLGRLNPDGINSADPADLRRIDRIMRESIGAPLGLDGVGAAAAILRIANVKMSAALRLISIARGHDPRDFVYFPFGGAGPLHAVELARELNMRTVVVPRFPGLTSALGCIIADVRHDFAQTVNRPLADVELADVNAVFAAHAKRGKALIAQQNVSVEAVEAEFEAELLYRGQSHVLRIGVSYPLRDVAELRARFEQLFLERFDIALDRIPIILACLRTVVLGRRPRIDLTQFTGTAPVVETPATRDVWFSGRWMPTPIHRREALCVGSHIRGPAIVEQVDTTILLDPGSDGHVDAIGNLVVTLGEYQA